MKYLYIGPSRPYGLPLRRNMILGGAAEEIWPSHAEDIAAHPELKQLIVSIPKAATALAQLKQTGSTVQRAAEAVKAANLAAKRARKKKEGK